MFIAGVLLGGLFAVLGFAWVLRGYETGGKNVQVLKLAHTLDSSHPVHKGIVHMKERLEGLSGGSMSIEIYPSSVLGGETEVLEQVQNGVLAMTKTSTGVMESFAPEMKVFGLPYLFEDADHFWSFAGSGLGSELLVSGADRNLYGLCYYDAGSRSFYNKLRPIKTPDDLSGMKIRVQNSPMMINMVKTLGASPTPISWGELYSALAQGIVDGAENNPPSFYTNKHYETCEFFSLDEHVRLPDLLLINTQIWESLDPQQQAWLQQAANESSEFQRELWAADCQKAIQEVEALGVEVFYPEKQPFMDKVAPIYEQFSGTPLGELAVKIREFRNE